MTLTEFESVAKIAANIVTVLTLGFAIWKLPYELKRARREKRISKRSEVGGDVLVATLRFLTELENATSVAITTTQVDQPTIDTFRAEVSHRNKRVAMAANDFFRAWALAETYLPERVNSFLSRVNDERATILSSQQTLAGLPQDRWMEFSDIYKAGLGNEAKKRVDALRKEAYKILRPIAQMLDEPEDH